MEEVQKLLSLKCSMKASTFADSPIYKSNMNSKNQSNVLDHAFIGFNYIILSAKLFTQKSEVQGQD